MQNFASDGVQMMESTLPSHIGIVVVLVIVVDVVFTHVLQNTGHLARIPAPTVSWMQKSVVPRAAQSSGSATKLQCGVVDPVCVVVVVVVVVTVVTEVDVTVVGHVSQRTGHVSGAKSAQTLDHR